MDFKKILVAVDASENALRAVSYTGEIIGESSREFKITLLYIARPSPPERLYLKEGDSLKADFQHEKKRARAFMSEARRLLEAKGIDPISIEERVVEAKTLSIAQDILSIQQDEGFGTVVVGRRGVTKAEEFLFGSVSNKIVHYAKNCSVWVVE